MKAHELARLLLAGPDVPVLLFDEMRASYRPVEDISLFPDVRWNLDTSEEAHGPAAVIDP